MTFSFYPLRFTARALTVVPDCHPYTRLSSLTILLHVALGGPGLLLASGVHSSARVSSPSLYISNLELQVHLQRLSPAKYLKFCHDIYASKMFFSTGIPGHPGPQGPNGPPGRNGLNGIPGTKGEKGEPGLLGRRGRKGSPGESGINGTNGIPGWRGKEGRMGMRGPAGPPGQAGSKGEPGTPGQQGPPGSDRILRVCNCERNVPTQVFYVISGYWISESHMTGFQDVASADGEFHVKVVVPVTYVLHIGGKTVYF